MVSYATPAPESLPSPGGDSRLSAILRGQAVFYVLTGIWPSLSMSTFEAVTGPKTDDWLVQTVGVLILVIGVVLWAGASKGRTWNRAASKWGPWPGGFSRGGAPKPVGRLTVPEGIARAGRITDSERMEGPVRMETRGSLRRRGRIPDLGFLPRERFSARVAPRPSREVLLLSVGSAGGLAVVDILFTLEGTISPIYLADAAVELAIAGAVLALGSKKGRP